MSMGRTCKNFIKTFEVAFLGFSSLLIGVAATFLLGEWVTKFHHPPILPATATTEQIAAFSASFNSWVFAFDKAEILLVGVLYYVVFLLCGLLFREIYRKGHTLYVSEHSQKEMVGLHESTRNEREELKRKNGEQAAEIASLKIKIKDLEEGLPGRVVDDIMVRAAAMRRQLPPPEKREEKDVSPPDTRVVSDTETEDAAVTTEAEKAAPAEVLEIIGQHPTPKTTTPVPVKPKTEKKSWWGKLEQRLGMTSER